MAFEDKGASSKVNRREFLETSGKAALGVGLGMLVADGLSAPARAEAQKPKPPSEKIRVGFIGVGGMGTNVLRVFLSNPNCEVVAVCDADENHLSKAVEMVDNKYEKKPVAHKDFRKILDMKDVDAVSISTPDHWHALPFIHACEAGKDIFCEKPVSHNIVEANSMLSAARRYNRVVQINTWQRSVGFYKDAIDFVRSGKMGKIQVCRAWTIGRTCTGHQEPKAPPAHLDYDLWLGPADYIPYQDNRCHFSWRWYYEFGGGLSTDWGVHMMDIILLGMNSWQPNKVSSYGKRTKCADNDDSTVPDTHIAVYEFPDFIMHWETRNYGEGLDGGRGHGVAFIGEKGKLIVDRDGIIWNPYEKDMPGPEKVHEGRDHIQNFLENVKSRGKCTSDIETSTYTTNICHLANLAFQRGETIHWNSKKMEPVGDRKVKDLLAYQRRYRKPWKLPIYKVDG